MSEIAGMFLSGVKKGILKGDRFYIYKKYTQHQKQRPQNGRRRLPFCYVSLALSLYIYTYTKIYSPNKALAEEGFLLGFYRSTFAHQVFGPSSVVVGRRRLLA